MKKKKQLGKYEKGIIITGVAVLIIFLILLTANGIKNMGKNNNNLALSEQEEVVPPNVPELSAGMIPVKYEGDNLVICKNDNTWYNYEEGTPAYMMLNDGVYQSELVVDMTGKKLASKNIGKTILKEDQGTIYMWIPRFTKNIKTKEIKYIEPEINLGGEWETLDTFIHKQIYDETKPDYSLSGIWIEKEPLASTAEVNTKVANMTGEENKYGFIGNTVATNAGIGDCHVAAEPWLTGTVPSGIANPENINRTIIKVINDKHYEPIKARIAYNETAGTVEIAVTYNKNGIQKIEDRNGNSVAYSDENGKIKAIVTVKAGKNHFTIIDNKNNKKELEVTVALPIYAKLYTDGTLALTNADKTIAGKTVDTAYGDISKYNGQKWSSKREKITAVDIVDEIVPLYTTYWFQNCKNLTNINNIGNLDTSNITNMRQMFEGCNKLTSLDLSSFNTSSVTNMTSMFGGCSSLTGLDVSSFDTRNVTDMSFMFNGCSGLTKLDISNFDTRNVSGMYGMFQFCSNLTELDVSNFDTSNVTITSQMFLSCTGLIKLDLSNFNTSNVTNMSYMFCVCSNLTELDLSSFDTSNVTDMAQMFNGCSSLLELDLSSFDTSNVTDMNLMFCVCSNLTELDLSNFNTSNVTNMNRMFPSCSNLIELDLSSFDTSNVTDMAQMFNGCSSLLELDLSSFNTKNVTTMHYMFNGCTNLKTIYVGIDWILAPVRTYMFDGCGTSTTTRK